MTTSGTTVYNLTAGQIVEAALRKLSAISKGQTAGTTDVTNGLQALNVLLKTFQAKGMPLWAISEYSFSLTATREYTIGLGQTINIAAPLKIIQAYNKDTTQNTSIPMRIQTRTDYNIGTPVSVSTGTPVNLLYRVGNQAGTICVWPLPDTYSISNRQITIVYQRPFEDVTASSETLDFPQYWLEAIIYGLAHRLAPEYGTPNGDRGMLKQEAKEFLEEALSFGTEEGSLYIQPTWEGRP